MKQNILVLSVNPYSMNDNGRVNEGISIRYLTQDNLDAIVNENGSLGVRPAKDNLPYRCKDLFVAAPAIYEADLGIKVGSDGKPVMAISSISYVSSVKLSTVKETAKA